jgi:hypothetical protein
LTTRIARVLSAPRPKRTAAWAAAVALCLAALSPEAARAQSGDCRLSVESTSVVLGQAFRVEATCHAEGAEVGMPELDLSDFEVMSRQVSRPMQFTFGAGGQQRIIESTTRLAVLVRARRTGRFELGPATATVGSARVSSSTITVSVGDGGAGAPPAQPLMNPPGPSAPSPPPGASGPPAGPLDGAVYDEQAFLRTVVDRHEAFVGQQVTVTFYLYVRSLATQPQITQQPATDGFWVHELLDRNAPPDAVMQRVGATTFRVYTLRRFAAFPLREGTLTIGAMEMQVPVGNPIDMIFGGPQSALARTSLPVEIAVRPPPDGAPAGLPVHVGTLGLESALDRAQVPTGDAVTFDLRMTGLGQIDAIEPPTIAMDGLRVLQPEIDQRTTAASELVGGDRNIRWLLVPERAGTYTIGPFRWAVLDPASGTWSTAEAPARTLLAAGNATQPPPEAAPEEGSEGDDAPSEDETAAFGPVRTSSVFARRSTRIASTPWYGLGLALGPMALALTALVLFARRRRAARLEAGATDRAVREARNKLDDAAKAIEGRDTRAFYAAVEQALKQGLEARLGRAIGSLTHAELKRLLSDRGMASALASGIKDELEGAEMARFSAAGGEEKEMRSTLERARGLFGEILRFTPSPEDE